MNELDAAFYGKLNGDATLLTFVSGVFHRMAPQEQAYPFLIFHQQAGVDWYTLKQRGGRDLVYLVKVVASGMSTLVSGQAMARVDVLLTDQTLTVSGFTAINVRRREDIEYAETDAGVIYQHVGALFVVNIV